MNAVTTVSNDAVILSQAVITCQAMKHCSLHIAIYESSILPRKKGIG